MRSRALGFLGAVALDALAGEPPTRLHPVVGIGRLLGAGYEPLRRARPAAQLVGGSAVLAGVAVLAGGAAAALQRVAAPLVPLTLKPTFAVRQLLVESLSVAGALERDGLPEARHRLRALVSRPTAELDASLVAAAAIESVAENLVDSVVAPWLAYAVFGLPGAAVYRVVNTADAMYGYRGELEWLGKSAARADDALNLVPGRVAAAALVLAATLALGRDAGRRGLRAWREDGGRTASPNAGRPMAVMAGCLGRRLEKRGHYVLGAAYPPPDAADVRGAARLAVLAAGLTGAAVLGALAVRSRRWR
jgi:adenosylcobinamide-phosphate synthase